MTPPPGAGLAARLAEFARSLRREGIAVGGDQILAATRAVAVLGLTRREDFYWGLAAALVHRAEQRPAFARAFARFWDAAAPAGESPPEPPIAPESPLLAVATSGEATAGEAPGREAQGGWSDSEALRRKDFEAMTAAEREAALRAIATLPVLAPWQASRRSRIDPAGRRLDLRRSFRASLRGGGAIIALARRAAVVKPSPIIVLCDISGSMSAYSRPLLAFVHRLARLRRGVHLFLFGTRLTPVTRLLDRSNADEALAALGRAATDWEGGTRIGAAAAAFNQDWSRRLPCHAATVLLMTDGIDRDEGQGLDAAVSRLRRSCKRLIWLNPLLRYAGYAPLAMGARVLAALADEALPAHSLASLAGLGVRLAARKPARRLDFSPVGA